MCTYIALYSWKLYLEYSLVKLKLKMKLKQIEYYKKKNHCKKGYLTLSR